MVKRRCTQKHREELTQLMDEYIEVLKQYKTNSDSHEIDYTSSEMVEDYFQQKAIEICPNDDERINIMLELCYGENNIKTNKEFCWMIVADLLLKKRGLLDE
jgi:hypothetical protein